LPVSQEPEVTTVSFDWGSGTLKRILAAGSAGAFSLPPEDVPPVPFLPSVLPVPPLEDAVSCFLPSSPEDLAYQMPPPTISAITTTAATMMKSAALFFPPPGCAGCGCVGIWGPPG
jgi:hypothetical protein